MRRRLKSERGACGWAVRVKLTPSGKRGVRRLRPKVLKVGLLATDAAGNIVSTR